MISATMGIADMFRPGEHNDRRGIRDFSTSFSAQSKVLLSVPSPNSSDSGVPIDTRTQCPGVGQ